LIRKHPSLFGVPFLILMVGASFALVPFTQTRYDLQEQQTSQVTKEQELKLEKDRKKFDLREAYYEMGGGQDNDDWEPTKRIPRPPGLPEWGVAPPEAPPKPSDMSS
ncbi:cytochrome c oxidase assembly protein COX16-domain-containing protein, partial [Vararia minispora EC-137]